MREKSENDKYISFMMDGRKVWQQREIKIV